MRNNSKDSQIRKIAKRWAKEELIPNVRDYEYQLTKLTEWGFWADRGGQCMISIDSLLAYQISVALLEDLEFESSAFILELNEIFDFIPDENLN